MDPKVDSKVNVKVQEIILQDPRVRAAVQQAGQEALADPQVQQQILDICKQRFPEVAAAVQQQVVQWANDPEVQKRACELAGVASLYAGHAVNYAGQAAGQAGDEFLKLIEQGPAGVRILAFFGGVLSCVNACLMMSDFLKILTSPMRYVLFLYQFIFSVTTILFEATPEWIAQVPVVTDYQDLVIAKAQFLSEVAGRGLFYGFQGCIWFQEASFPSILLGLYFFVLCAFHLSMEFGIMPQHIAQKIREGGYAPLPISAGFVDGPRFLVTEEASATIWQPETLCDDSKTDGVRPAVTVATALDTGQPKGYMDSGGLEQPQQNLLATKQLVTEHEGNPEGTELTPLLNQQQPEVSQEKASSREMILQLPAENSPAPAEVMKKKKTQQKCCSTM